MRILSFILAFGVVLAVPSLTATTESNLPGAGAFTYSGSQSNTATSTAHLTLAPRGKQLPASTQGHARDVARG